jgi:hypothetical protein
MGDADKSEARDFVMARLFAARAAAQSALTALDEAAMLFLDPTDEDEKGTKRKDLLEDADASLGVAAQGVQAAMEAFPEIDAREAEDLDGDPDEEEEDDEGEDEPERAAPRRRGRRS